MDSNTVQVITDNAQALLPVLLPLLGNFLASVICALTKTPPKTGIFGKVIYPLIEIVALNIFKAKQKAPEA